MWTETCQVWDVDLESSKFPWPAVPPSSKLTQTLRPGEADSCLKHFLHKIAVSKLLIHSLIKDFRIIRYNCFSKLNVDLFPLRHFAQLNTTQRKLPKTSTLSYELFSPTLKKNEYTFANIRTRIQNCHLLRNYIFSFLLSFLIGGYYSKCCAICSTSK